MLCFGGAGVVETAEDRERDQARRDYAGALALCRVPCWCFSCTALLTSPVLQACCCGVGLANHTSFSPCQRVPAACTYCRQV